MGGTAGPKTCRPQIREAGVDRKLFRGLPVPWVKLVIELDGSQHDESLYDEARDRWIAEQGYMILRFWNADILRNRVMVLETILAAIDGTLPAQRATDLKVKTAGP